MAGSASDGTPEGMSPTVAMPWPGRSRSADEGDGEDDDDDRAGHGQPERARRLEDGEHRRGEREGGPVDVGGLAGEVDEGREDAVGGDGGAGDALELAGDDRERDAGEEADEDRARQEGREDAEAEQPAAEIEAADDQRQHRGDGGAIGGVEARHGGEDGGHDGDGGGVGTDDQLARRAEDGVGDERRDRGVEAGLGRQAGDRRIGDGGGQADRGDGEAGGDVALDPARPVAGEARQHRPGRGRVADAIHGWSLALRAAVSGGGAH